MQNIRDRYGNDPSQRFAGSWSNRQTNYHPTSLNQVSVNRPTINQSTVNQGSNINVTGPTTVSNTQVASNTMNNFASTNVAAANNFVRPWGALNSGWYQGSWGGGWPALPGVWAGQGFVGPGYVGGVGTAVAVPSDPGWTAPVASAATVVYNNPYYAAPSDSSTTVESPASTVPTPLDYSRPIAVPTREEEANEDQDLVGDAKQEFERARTAFKGTMYRTALSRAGAGLELLPGDTAMHEFRALCLFALGRFRESTEALYAVLSAGPGWNWNTMASLYADPDTYTRQLRRLEKYVKENPKDARGHFLLGYHYLVLDERTAAAGQFGVAAKLQPKDKLSASLATALTAKPSNQEASEE